MFSPILYCIDFFKVFFIERDALHFALDKLLSKTRKNDKFHTIAFYSKIILLIKINYKIYDKKLLIIIDSFQE